MTDKYTLRCPTRANGLFYADIVGNQTSWVGRQDCASAFDYDNALRFVRLLAVMTATSPRDWILDLVGTVEGDLRKAA